MEPHDQEMPLLIYTHPFTRINEKWKITSSNLVNILETQQPPKGYRNFDDVFLFYSDPAPNISQRVIVHLVTETVFNYPNIFLSEKTFKPFINKRPFLLASSPGCLKNLQDLGFKTFNDYWDESYDAITDPVDRIIAIVDILEALCQLPFSHLLNMLDNMQPILEHNYNHYKFQLKANELKKFEELCQKNLER